MDYNNETNNHNNNGITEPIVSILEEEEDEILNDDHQEQQHQEYIQEYKCPYCTYTNTNMNESNEYVEHVRDHLNGKSFRCVLCNLMYKYRGDCVVHLKRKHSNIDLQAHNYVEQFSLDTVSPTQIYLLLKPKQQVDEDNDEKLFACSYCDYRANYKGDIFKHHSRKHPNQPRNIISLNSTNNNNNKSNLNDTSYFDQSNNNLNDTSYFDTTTNNLNNTTYNTTNNFDEDELIDEQQHQDEIIEHDQIEGEEYGENDENMFDYNDNPIIEEDEQQHQEQNHQQSMNNNNNQLQCTFCSYIGRSYAKLQLHLATHYNLKKFMCPICNKRANFKWDVQKHIRKVHNDNVSQVICLSEPEARESINSYVKVVNRSQSQLAPSTPNQQTSVVSENVSPTKQLISLNGNTKNKFKCSLCSKTSSWQWDIRKHMREMHKNQICDLIVLDNNSISNNSNSQPTPTSFNNQSICTDATGNKKFKCTLCPYRSNWKGK
jgi:cytochrome c-type biogenesis protein CcmH/NrfF